MSIIYFEKNLTKMNRGVAIVRTQVKKPIVSIMDCPKNISPILRSG